MRYLLSFLLLFGITFGQKIVTMTETEGDEKKVEVRKEITDNKMTVKITKDGRTEEYSADLDDEEAIAEIEQKLEDIGEGEKIVISKRIKKHDCDKENCDKEKCKYAKEHCGKDSHSWHMKDDDLKKVFKLKEPMIETKPSGYLGVHIQNLTDQLAEYFKVKEGKGVLVTEVEDDSPAEKAGLKAGDIITKINDEEVTTTGELSKAVRSYDPEAKVTVSVLRNGKNKKLNATLAESEMKMFYAHHDFEMPDIEKFDFHDFRFKEDELKAHLKVLDKELEELKKELQELREEK